MISHGGLSNYLCWSSRAYDLSQAVALRCTLAQLRLTGDRPVYPLITGGWVDLLAEERGVEALSQALRDGRPSYFW